MDDIDRLRTELVEAKAALSELTLKVELSRKDIEEVQKFQNRIHDFIDDFQDSIFRIDKILEIQELVAGNSEKAFLDKTSDIIAQISALKEEVQGLFDKDHKEDQKRNVIVDSKIEDLDSRLRTIEKYQWKIAGGIIVAAALLSFFTDGLSQAFKLFGG